MATTEIELKRLKSEVETLKKKVARLERRENGKRRSIARKRRLTTPRLRKRGLNENERADQILRRAGLLAEPTEREKQLVAEWRAVPESERNRLLDQFRSTKLNIPLSQIVIEQRR